MAGHLSTRIWAAATTPVVRELGPLLNNLFRTFAQFIGFTILACLILLLPTPAPVAMALSLIAMLFGLVVVADMVWITYRKPEEVVYPTVEAFPDREPI